MGYVGLTENNIFVGESNSNQNITFTSTSNYKKQIQGSHEFILYSTVVESDVELYDGSTLCASRSFYRYSHSSSVETLDYSGILDYIPEIGKEYQIRINVTGDYGLEGAIFQPNDVVSESMHTLYGQGLLLWLLFGSLGLDCVFGYMMLYFSQPKVESAQSANNLPNNA